MGKRSQSSVEAVSNALIYPPPRSIELEPEDWLWASWRPRAPLPWPEPCSFNREEALSRLARVTAQQTCHHRWPEADIQVALSPEEALFWFLAITGVVPNREEYQHFKQSLAIAPLSEPLSAEQVLSILNASLPYSAVPELIIPLVNLFPLPELIHLLSDDRLFQPRPVNPQALPPLPAGLPLPNLSLYAYLLSPFDWRSLHQLVKGFRRYILPYLSQADIEALHPHLRPKLDPSFWKLYPAPSERLGLYLLAASLGMHKEVLELVETWTDESCKQDYCFITSEVIFGLGDPKLVEHHIRRLKRRLPLWQVRIWLAHTEHTALDYVREEFLDPDLARRVKVPEAAPHMLALTLAHRSSKAARQWLQDNPAQAIAGLIPIAVGGGLSEAAVTFLRQMKRMGHEAYIRQCLTDQPADVASKVQKLVLATEEVPALDAQSTPDWWLASLPSTQKIKPPTWLNVLELPLIRIGKFSLNPQQVTDLLIALKQSKLNAPHPLIGALKAHANSTSLDTFVWQLFEIWLAEDAPPKEGWAMVAVGLLGTDASVLKLAPLIREMPGEGHHKRAVLGLECLSAIGTDMALMHINTIAQKVKYKGLKKKAEECIAAIAQSRQLTPEQLEDRIVPDFGLDQRGTWVFDYGSRQFHLVLGGEQPMVRDADGKLMAHLPKPKAKDDQALAEQAIADWKLFKQQIQEVMKTQVDRLEKAMITQRRWQPDEFDAFLVHHPLMTHLTQRLIWGLYGPDGLTQSFRVTEDLTYADEHDRDLLLPPDSVAMMGLVHPAQLSVEQRGLWGELFSDYELIQPFSQISRTIFELSAEEMESQYIQRFQGVEVSVVTLMGILKKTGWSYTFKTDAQTYYCKIFPFANITAVIEHLSTSRFIYDTSNTTLNTCFFLSGLHPDGVSNHQPQILKDISLVVLSEVLRNLGAIAAKSK